MKIKINRQKCVGAGSCVIFADKVFELDDEGKAVVKDPKGNSEEDILKAAESCPVDAIEVYDEQGRKLYPKYD